MNDDQDASQKTEEPTAKRIRDAREKGDVPNSREVSNFFMIAAGTLVVAFWLPAAGDGFKTLLATFFINAHSISVERAALPGLTAETVAALGKLLALPALAFVVAALASGLVQNGVVFTGEKIKPELSKISPLKGLKRLFSLQTVAEFIKGLAKLGIVGAIAAVIAWNAAKPLPIIPLTEIDASLAYLHREVVKILATVVAAIAVMALVDFLYQRFEHLKKLRMSVQDVKDEVKQTEGDPHIKARLRAIRSERARQRMIQAVPSADVVVTNPTHFAVAMSYDRDGMAAPRVVAKGSDDVAQRIRAVAEKHDVPVVENPPLARALYAGVEIDEEIKPEHYQIVAEVIAYVYRLRGDAPTAAGRDAKLGGR